MHSQRKMATGVFSCANKRNGFQCVEIQTVGKKTQTKGHLAVQKRDKKRDFGRSLAGDIQALFTKQNRRNVSVASVQNISFPPC